MKSSGPGVPVLDYYIGVDLGQKRDHSVVAVVRRKNGHSFLVHLKRFPLGTEYQQVLEYLKLAGERFLDVRAFYIDQTGVGEVFVENARKYGLRNVRGIELSLPQKQDVMTNLRQIMEQKRLHIPGDRELILEMNMEIAQLTQTGKTKFYHRSGTHDDRLWALALAVYGSRHETPRYHPFAALGRNHLAWLTPNLPRSLLNPQAAVTPARPWDNQSAGPLQRTCSFCGAKWLFEPGKDSPCGHVKADGTQVLPEPNQDRTERYTAPDEPCPWPPPRSSVGH